jgi:hypothetical protein
MRRSAGVLEGLPRPRCSSTLRCWRAGDHPSNDLRVLLRTPTGSDRARRIERAAPPVAAGGRVAPTLKRCSGCTTGRGGGRRRPAIAQRLPIRSHFVEWKARPSHSERVEGDTLVGGAGHDRYTVCTHGRSRITLAGLRARRAAMIGKGLGEPENGKIARVADRRTSDAQGSAADADHTASDADQTASDADQTASDIDQTSSDRDEVDSASDQRASDQEQARADRHRPGDENPGEQEAHEAARSTREANTSSRRATNDARAETARSRDETATGRDTTAATRDETARRRDVRTQAIESSLAASDAPPAEKFERVRARAAADRARAAKDRVRAAQDRADSGRERARLQGELHSAVWDRPRRAAGDLHLVDRIGKERANDRQERESSSGGEVQPPNVSAGRSRK